MLAVKSATRSVAVALVFCAGLSALPAAAERGGGGDHLIQAITAFKAQLNLNTSQQALWDAAVAASRATREAAMQRRQSVKPVVTEELASADPNLTRIAAAVDQAQDANTAARRQVRNQWLAVYNTFSPEQKAVVKSAIERRMSRMENFRERMQERFRKG
ncbi:MAG: periplasmic heavy metal sensor [Betaproteobacteria bacterium]